MKICSGCGKEKELFDFRRDKWARDYHRSECKTCSSARDVGYRLSQRFRKNVVAKLELSKR